MSLLTPHLPLGMNGLELILATLVLGGVLVFNYRKGWSWREALACVIFIMPVVYITVAECTQFMTMDEWGISAEFMNPDQRGLRQISSAFLTGGALAELPFIRLMQLAGASETTIRMLLKGLWWLAGNTIIVALVTELMQLGKVSIRSRAAVFGAVFAAIALLPTIQLALKTVNYDLISSGFGALALLVFIRGLATSDARLRQVALILAILAAQEKFTAGPILVFIIVARALVTAGGVAGVGKRIAAAVKSAVSATIISLLIPAASLSLYRILGPPSVPDDFWMEIVAPLSSWSQVPFGLVPPLRSYLEAHRWLTLGAVCPTLIVGATAAAAAVLPMLGALCAAWAKIPRYVLAFVCAIVVTSIYAVGVVGAETVTAYWAPFHPTPLPGEFMQRLNGVILHTGAATAGQHYIQLDLYAVAVTVVAVPSAAWLFGVLGLPFACFTLNSNSDCRLTIALLLFVGACLLPVASALAGMPFASRYFNVSLLLLVSALILFALPLLDLRSRWSASAASIALSLAMAACLLVEAAPFRPLFAAFRPFWLSYGDSRRAELGRLNASWMGWGEEIMTGGKMLQKACRKGEPTAAGHPCQDVTLYVMNSGLWLPGPSDLHVEFFLNKKNSALLDDKSFYLVDRLYLIQDVYNTPEIEPDFTIAYRGYALAWIFRGDRLAASGYKFGRQGFRTF